MIFGLHLRFILFSHTSILHFISQFHSWHCIAFTWNSSFFVVFDFFSWPDQITNYLSIIFTCGKPSLAWKFNCFSCLRIFDNNLHERYTSTYEKSFLAWIILYIRSYKTHCPSKKNMDKHSLYFKSVLASRSCSLHKLLQIMFLFLRKVC